MSSNFSLGRFRTIRALRVSTLLAVCSGLWGALSNPAGAQTPAPAFQEARQTSVALLFAPQREIVAGSGSGFWLQGGAADVDFPIRAGLKAALNVHGATIGTSPSASPGVAGAGLSLLTVTAGPRYFIPRLPLGRSKAAGLFVESLFGFTHGSGSTFPGGSQVASSADSFAMQLGGGLDVHWTTRVNVRALEVDYARSTLPNGGANSQNGLRVAAGIVFRVR